MCRIGDIHNHIFAIACYSVLFILCVCVSNIFFWTTASIFRRKKFYFHNTILVQTCDVLRIFTTIFLALRSHVQYSCCMMCGYVQNPISTSVSGPSQPQKSHFLRKNGLKMPNLGLQQCFYGWGHHSQPPPNLI